MFSFSHLPTKEYLDEFFAFSGLQFGQVKSILPFMYCLGTQYEN